MEPRTDVVDDPISRLGQPMPFRLLLDEGVKLFRLHFKRIFPAVALPLALAQTALIVTQLRWMQSLGDFVQAESPGEAFAGSFGVGCLLFAVGFVVYMLVYIGGYTAMAAAAVDGVAGRPLQLGRRWRFAFRPGVFFPLLVMGLAVTFGMVFCLAPGFYILCVLGFVLPAMVEEGQLGFSSWSRSAELTRYNPQGTLTTSPRAKLFVLVIVGYILSYVAALVVQVPFGIVQQVMLMREAMEGGGDPFGMMTSKWQWLQVPATFLGSLVQVAVAIYVAFTLALLYFDVRRRREGADLEAAVEWLLARRGTAEEA